MLVIREAHTGFNVSIGIGTVQWVCAATLPSLDFGGVRAGVVTYSACEGTAGVGVLS